MSITRKICALFSKTVTIPLLLLTVSGPASAQAAKKMIAWGADTPDTSVLNKNIQQIEKAPFDGCVFYLTSRPHAKTLAAAKEAAKVRDPGVFHTPDPGVIGDFSLGGWGTRVFTKEEMQQDVDNLKSTKFKKFTDCFARYNVWPGKVDWFSPNFETVVHNAGIAAWVMKQGGVRGAMFDTEWIGDSLWDYHKQEHAKTKTYQEYAAQVRKCGAEVMKAFQAEYPDITLILTYGYSGPWVDVHPWPYAPGENAYPQNSNDPRKLEWVAYGLLAPFVDGMIEAAGPNVHLIDGSEFTYTHLRRSEFIKARRVFTTDVLPLMADDVKPKYPKVFSQAMATYFDAGWTQPGGWNATDTTNNFWQPNETEVALINALHQTDKYAWLYSESVGLLGPRSAQWMPSIKALPTSYFDAISNARKAAGIVEKPAPPRR